MTYQEKLKDPRWQKKRLAIMERDEWTCQECRNNKSQLHVHHKFYIKGNDPWDYPDEALTTLCGESHEIESNNRKACEYELIHSLKRLFTVSELRSIVRGFEDMDMWDTTSNVAEAYGWALSNSEIQKDILAKYVEYCKKTRWEP